MSFLVNTSLLTVAVCINFGCILLFHNEQIVWNYAAGGFCVGIWLSLVANEIRNRE